MKKFALGIGCILISICSTSCLAASTIVSVAQVSEYPRPGKVSSYPPGLLFEVCTSGAVFRAFGEGSPSRAEKGVLEKSALKDFRTVLEKEWLAPLRAECKARGIIVDAASIRIKAASGEFDCSRYNEGEALKGFESKIWSLELKEVKIVDPRIHGSCK
ncbi:hypothetical protein [Dokdonella sp.]|uniref:hypothetical protein n=1 Tax=Dokdonella sp. TaxID=2291710 RepID=UPI0035279DD1